MVVVVAAVVMEGMSLRGVTSDWNCMLYRKPPLTRAPPPKNIRRVIYKYVDLQKRYNIFLANNLLIAKFP
jgi:hypothetical protein